MDCVQVVDPLHTPIALPGLRSGPSCQRARATRRAREPVLPRQRRHCRAKRRAFFPERLPQKLKNHDGMDSRDPVPNALLANTRRIRILPNGYRGTSVHGLLVGSGDSKTLRRDVALSERSTGALASGIFTAHSRSKYGSSST